jgi:hypothetical protein
MMEDIGFFARLHESMIYPKKVYAPQPIYIPKKHTVCSYRSQQRAAKKRRKAR